MNKCAGLLISLIMCLCLTGCAKLPPTSEINTSLLDIIEITDNKPDSKLITIVEDKKISNFLEKNNDYVTEEEGYRWIVATIQEPFYKINIATQENEKFIYRNLEYDIEWVRRDGYIRYKIPGACDDYMLFIYN